MATVSLYAPLHSRTGDAGGTQILSMHAYDPGTYTPPRQAVTAGMARQFQGAVHGRVARDELARLFVRRSLPKQALVIGVDDSAALDTHGWSRSSFLLNIPTEVPDSHQAARS
jgi:hypothetical protein